MSVPSNCTCRACLWSEAAASPGEGALLRLTSTGGPSEGVREDCCAGGTGCGPWLAWAVGGAAELVLELVREVMREVAPARAPEEVRLSMGDLRKPGWRPWSDPGQRRVGDRLRVTPR